MKAVTCPYIAKPVMTNSKYKEGALRLIIDKSGGQFVAMPSGEKLPGITETTVFQDMEMCRNGICMVRFDALVNYPGHPNSNSYMYFKDGMLFLDSCRVLIEGNIELKKDLDECHPAGVSVSCSAYPDPTK